METCVFQTIKQWRHTDKIPFGQRNLFRAYILRDKNTPPGLNNRIFSLPLEAVIKIIVCCMNTVKSGYFLLFFLCWLNVGATEVCDSLRTNTTGSVTTVTRNELKQFGATPVFKILSILDPSVIVQEDTRYGSDPNKIADIAIRGNEFLSGLASLPVILVDGFQVDLHYVYDMDIERIEKIHILKDAAASAIYGSRSTNGIISIETRTPESGIFRISYANRTSLSKADLSSFDFMNAAERLEAERQSGLWTSSDSFTQHKMDSICTIYEDNINKGVNTAWHKKPLRNAFSHQHSLFVSGRPGKWAYGASGNYNKNNGVMKNSQRENYGFSVQAGYLNTERISIRNTFSWNKSRQENPSSTYDNYTSNSPYLPLYDDAGDLIPVYPHAGGFNSVQYNWVYHEKTPYRDEASLRSLNNNFSVDLKILSGLSLKTEATYSKEKGKSERYTPPGHPSFSGHEFYSRGAYTCSDYSGTKWDIRTALNYTTNIRRHFISAGIGYNYIKSKAESEQTIAQGFLDEQSDHPASSTYNFYKLYEKLSAVFGTLNYVYDRRYQLDFSFRNDHVSTLNDEEKSQNSWSVGAGWNIHNEAFLSGTDGLTTLRIRGSVGEINSPEHFLFDKESSVLFSTIYRTTFNYRIKQNIGLDLSLAKDRISMVFNYYTYRSKCTDRLSIAYPEGSYLSPLRIKTKRYGFEAYLKGSILRQKDFEWTLSLSALYNKDKIRSAKQALTTPNGTNWDSSFDMPSNLTPDPKWRGTIGNRFNWRQFSLDIAMQYALGGKQYFQSIYEGSGLEIPSGIKNRWSKTTSERESESVRTPVRYIEDNDYLRMSNIALFYTLSENIIKRWHITNLEIGVNVSDLFYTTKADSPRGQEYPFARQYTFNLRFSL